MIDSFFKEFSDNLNLAQFLSTYQIEIGVFYNESVQVHYLDLDGIDRDRDIPISDLVYFSEYGTILFPGKFILEHILNYISEKLNSLFDQILDGIFNNDWSQSMIDENMRNFETEINLYIQFYLNSYTESVTFLSSTLQIPSNTYYIMDIAFLKKYIKCRIIKK